MSDSLLKRQVAAAALEAATAAIEDKLGDDYSIDVLLVDEPLLRQVRVSLKDGTGQGPRYFLIKVSEQV